MNPKILSILLLALVLFVLIVYYFNGKYDREETAQIGRFLEQTSADGVKTNGQVLGYCKRLPLFWGGVITITHRDGARTVSTVGFFDKRGSGRTQLKGTLCLSDFKNIKALHIERNAIDTLMLINCESLEEILCFNNNLQSLSITNCPRLTHLSISDNPLETIDVTGCPGLKEFEAARCPLKELKVLESQPWQTWGIDTTFVHIIITLQK